MTIDGVEYEFDKDTEYNDTNIIDGSLLFDGHVVKASDVTKCNKIQCYPNTDASKNQNVTKFLLTKSPKSRLNFDMMSFCSYYYYVTYKDYKCRVVMDDNGTTCSFKALVPMNLLQVGGSEVEYQQFDVSAYTDDDTAVKLTRC